MSLFLIILLYIILGMFLDGPSAIVLTLPVLFPVILSLGFDPTRYGVIMVRVIEIGLITPPMGLNVRRGDGYAAIDDFPGYCSLFYCRPVSPGDPDCLSLNFVVPAEYHVTVYVPSSAERRLWALRNDNQVVHRSRNVSFVRG